MSREDPPPAPCWVLSLTKGRESSLGSLSCLVAKSVSHVQLFATPWTVAHHVSWSGLPFPPPGDLLSWGSNPYLLRLLLWKANSLPLSHQESPESLYKGTNPIHMDSTWNTITLGLRFQPMNLRGDTEIQSIAHSTHKSYEKTTQNTSIVYRWRKFGRRIEAAKFGSKGQNVQRPRRTIQ